MFMRARKAVFFQMTIEKLNLKNRPHFPKEGGNPSFSETQGQLVGARESTKGRKKLAGGKFKERERANKENLYVEIAARSMSMFSCYGSR